MTCAKIADKTAIITIAIALALYPLLRGGLDLWSQALVQSALFGGLALWLAARALLGEMPDFLRLPAVPLLACGAWLLAWALSPAPGYCREAALNWIAGAAALYAAAMLDNHTRKSIFGWILLASWLMALFAIYQQLRGQPAAALFFNQNMFAGWLALLIPALLARGKWFQSALFFGVLLLTKSRGAAFALYLTSIIYLVFRGGVVKKSAAVMLAFAGGLVVLHMNTFSLAQRYSWWQAAVELIKLRPLSGFGPGTFGYAYATVHVPGSARFSTTFAHSYSLQLAAETGLLAAALWLGWILYRTVKTRRAEKWSITAMLFMSLMDYILVTPPNFLLFCWFLGMTCEQPRTVRIEQRGRRFLLTAAIICTGLAGIYAATLDHKADIAVLRAKAFFDSGDTIRATAALQKASGEYPQNPRAALLLAQADELQAATNRAFLSKSAVDYERALRLDPFRPASYDSLAKIYERLGNAALAAGVYERKAQWIKWWNPPPQKPR
ncbi:MAG: hypothetical protein PHP45_08785 [Elusimicrobiales bacterium]|nr:hypothetical protein [Elusimicrobiales bacterium]